MDFSEFGLIDSIRSRFPVPSKMLGIGDDCAIIPQHDGVDTLVSSDMLIEGSHFILSEISAYQLGWKAVAVNLSDIAAMGGKPVSSFMSIALPSRLNSEWISAFIDGYHEISSRYACALLGGDTTASPDRLCVNIGVIGNCHNGKALLRSGAQVGDKICVSGHLGNSAGGLKLIMEGERNYCPKLVEQHYMVVPRVEEGLLLASCPGVHAMMDISDGIASDLRHILKASGVGAEVDTAAIPISAELSSCCQQFSWDALELALCGGEDYELLFTASVDANIPIEHYVIGQVVEGSKLSWLGSQRDYMGYRHF